ncbi:MAG TPA: O-antigen ligase family protein [Thermoleophilaceae bacterium]|nr:O-antigen ligase family protein [Thermoleophilaceae bacterium]
MSAAPTRRPISQALLGAALVCATGWLCFRSGGFFHEPRATLAIAAWVGVAVVVLVPSGPVARLAIVPPSNAGRIAVAGLLALAGWTALSLLWAPLGEAAREDVWRLALYAAALPLAVAAFRERGVARALEPALALLAVVVVGYGLLGDLGLLDLTSSFAADGRLDQPLSYWNAMGALAAVGVLLCARIASDRTRVGAQRAAAALALPPLLAGLYLTYSRGALAAVALGLVTLALLTPEARPLWARAGRGWRLAVGWGAVALLAATLVLVAVDRASPPARGATADRFADIGSNRADYWRVAADSFADAPLRGVGTAGFRVEWLRERDVAEGAVDAHSLYLETAAELGLVGLAALAALLAGAAICARRLAFEDAALAAGPCAALAALALHAGIDWDWDLPALGLVGLLLVGVAIARAGMAEER